MAKYVWEETAPLGKADLIALSSQVDEMLDRLKIERWRFEYAECSEDQKVNDKNWERLQDIYLIEQDLRKGRDRLEGLAQIIDR